MNKKNYRILIVDDETEYQTVFSYILQKHGYDTLACSGGAQALALLEKNKVDLVMTDLKMPDMDGIELVKRVKERYEDVDVMVITAFGSIETAVAAMKYGACGYSIKNSEPEALLLDVEKTARIKTLERENRFLQEQNHTDAEMFLQSKNPRFRQILDTCRQVADSDINILVLGESGAGKEVIARYIHRLSERSQKPFVPVNCQVFSEGTLESELFGHEKGAFTGASGLRIGHFETADQGTLFLDEIGDIPLSLQGKLLRVLENKSIERVGSSRTIDLDIRLISATNKDLKKAIEQGTFREDLLYRINTLTIEVPPLRERKEDLPDLIGCFMRQIEKEQKKKDLRIEEETYEFLLQYDYPGNVRELKNLLERMAALSRGGVLRRVEQAEALPSSREPAGEEDAKTEDAVILPLRAARAAFEKAHIEKALRRTDGNVAAAAKLLEITKRQLFNKIAEYRIER